MLARLYLVFFLALIASISFADEANWNCQQDKTTKEWVCVGSAANAGGQASNPETKPQENPEATASKPTQTGAGGVTTPDDTKSEEEIKAADKEPAKPSVAEKPAVSEDKDAAVEKSPSTVVYPASSKPISPPEVAETPPPILPASQKPIPASNKPETVAKGGRQSGWNCDTKGKDGNWNCELVGADPKGEARTVESEEQRFSVLTPAFDNKEEHVFNTLRDRFKNNPWGNCTIQLGTQKYYLPDKKQRDFANVDMNSNAAEIYDNEIGNYQGRVELKRADQQASSNSANYDSVSETLDMHGNVYYSEDELALHTETANLKLATEEARLRDALFISPTTPIRGKASAVYRDSDTLSRYKDVAYTACQPGNQDWVVHASDLKMNKKDGMGSAKNAWIEFKGIPAFYSPYLSFPIDNRRMSGFLAPSFGRTQKGGFNFSAPFYWNIAPNYDATIRPRYYTNRGPLLAGDFRYLTEKTRGLVSAEYMPDDTVANKSRYLATIKNNTRYTPNISSNLDLNIVSDRAYFSELGNALSFPNFSHVRSFADASYIDKGISLTGIAESFQTIDPNLLQLGGRLKPYRRLPQINLNLDHEFESVPANIGLDNEYVYFQHDDSRLPDGHRFNVKPYASFPLKTASAFVTPKVELDHTQYLLNNQNPTVSDSIDRTVPIASIDSGLFVEKDVNLLGSSYLHTIEPRLFYLYIPKVNQNDIPIFDTSLYDFQYDSLFRENRYNGLDRIQDANQVSAALTTRLVDSESGLEKLKLNVGQIYYFRNREVVGPVVRIGADFLNNAVKTNTFSPFVAELSSQFNRHVAFQAGMQWDPEVNQVIRHNATLHFVNEPGEIVNIGYTYRKSYLIQDALDDALADNNLSNTQRATFQAFRNNDPLLRSNDIIQSDVSLRWPIYDDWFLVGRWQYSILYKQTQEAFVGFEKENCCWRFRIIGRRYINNLITANSVTTQTSNTQTGIFLQIELKGLTGLGEKLDDFFTQSIFGYQKKDY
jgi:LPS-assembly protein